jgi:GTPase SAR1 family protein
MGIGISSDGTDIINSSSKKVTGKVAVSIYGAGRTGKSSMVRKMKGLDFVSSYVPTKCTEVSRTTWIPMRYPDECMALTIYEVIESAPQSIDPLKGADGILIIYDPLRKETVSYAKSVIKWLPRDVPVMVLANFLDARDNRSKVSSELLCFADRIVHCQGSIKVGNGLMAVRKWMDEVFIFARLKRSERSLRENHEMSRRFESVLRKMAGDWNGSLPRCDKSRVDHVERMKQELNVIAKEEADEVLDRPVLAALLKIASVEKEVKEVEDIC